MPLKIMKPNQTKPLYIYIYIYIYICVCVGGRVYVCVHICICVNVYRISCLVLVCFGRVLWHINPCGLFNTKSCAHTHTHTHREIYIFDLFGNSLLVTLFLNKPELICLHTVKCFQVN